MMKRMIIMLFLCLLVLGGAFGYKTFVGKRMMQNMAAMGNQPQTVSTMKVGFEEWKNEVKAVGTLTAVKGIDLAPEIAGLVETISFESGQDVEKGVTLVLLRSKDERASLEALQAQFKLAELTVARDAKQIKTKAISQAKYDADKANRDSLKAQVAQQEARVEKKALTAPFAGRLGLRQIDVGQVINAGTAVVTLQQLDPLYLDFALPQQKLTHIKIGQKIVAKTDALPSQLFNGEITAIEAKVDEATRNINIRATIQNPEKLLRPGLFASLLLTVGAPEKHLTLPQTAVTFNPYGSTVYIAHPVKDAKKEEPQLKARMAFVTTGAKRGDQIVILSGLKEGDEVITSGQLKLQNGTLLIINNSVQPLNNPAPEPKDE